MSTTTSNLGLTLPAVSEAADISVLNTNFQKIDALGGYGLGSTEGGGYIDDCNVATTIGWYNLLGSSTLNLPTEYKTMGYGSLRVERRGSYITQTIVFMQNSAVRSSSDSGATWTSWEWVNPPMRLGVEYCTTERYMDMPVYVKMIEFGTLPNGTNKSVAHGINKTYTVRSEITCTGTGQMLEYNPGITWVAVTGTEVHITTNTDLSSFAVYFTVWYTK